MNNPVRREMRSRFQVMTLKIRLSHYHCIGARVKENILRNNDFKFYNNGKLPKLNRLKNNKSHINSYSYII